MQLWAVVFSVDACLAPFKPACIYVLDTEIHQISRP